MSPRALGQAQDKLREGSPMNLSLFRLKFMGILTGTPFGRSHPTGALR